MVCFYMITFIFKVVVSIFLCWQSMSQRKCGVKFDNVNHVLRITYDKLSSSQDLLRKDNSVSIHHRNSD